MQQKRAVADGTRAMSSPRNIYPDTTLYVTCRAVHRSFRLVPTKRVRRILEYVFAVVSDKYRRGKRKSSLEDMFHATGTGRGRRDPCNVEPEEHLS